MVMSVRFGCDPWECCLRPICLTAPVACAILRPQPNMILAGAWFCQAERVAEKPPTVAPDPGNAGVGIGIFLYLPPELKNWRFLFCDC